MARRPTADDLALWQRVTADIVPLRPRPAAVGGKPETPAAAAAAEAPPARHHARPAADPGLVRVKVPALLDEHGPGRVPGLDRRTALALKRGRREIDDTIDLHGMRQDEAHRALDGFLASAWRRNLRTVLVITGKGSRGDDGEREIGVLRRMLPHWLHEGANRERVLTFGAAHARHGGGGAFYVMLRRQRERP